VNEIAALNTALATASGTRECLVCGEKITDRTLLVGFAQPNSDIRSEIALHTFCAGQLLQAIGEKMRMVKL
jgi:hypothetical protein